VAKFVLGLLALLQLGTASAVSGSRQQEGCPRPAAIAAALTTLRERGWTTWGPEDLVKTWPMPLVSTGCKTPQGACVQLTHAGRETSEACECCETFQLFQDSVGGKGRERLSTVIIQYSAERYVDVLDAARLWAKTMGVPQSEGPVGQKEPPSELLVQSFAWDEPALRKRALLELQIGRRKIWFLHLSLSWHPNEL
jgi:hypothetical protein